MKRKGIPTRWENYLPMGCRVEGTRFLPFKVPLRWDLCKDQPESEQFTPSFLLESTPMLKAVIDLTNTDRYYDSEEFTNNGVLYKKVWVHGGGTIPSERHRKEFFDAVDQLCETFRHDSDALIGVHCTHGLNRTGYLICKYMVSRMKIDPQEAINKFQEARGHEIERRNYLDDIIHLGLPRPRSPEVNWRSEPRLVPSTRAGERLFTAPAAYRRNNSGQNYKHHNERNVNRQREREYMPRTSVRERSRDSFDRRESGRSNYESSRR